MQGTTIANDADTFQTVGRVIGLAGDLVEVLTSEGIVEARRALACLIEPEKDDTVLVVGPSSPQPFVLAVLSRPDHTRARISVDGDCTFESRSGRLTFAATGDIDIISKRSLSLASDRVELRAGIVTIVLRRVQLIASVVDATLERVTQSVKRVFRRVQEIEHVRAGQIDYSVEGNLRLHGEHTLLTARELVKADAKQIHVG